MGSVISLKTEPVIIIERDEIRKVVVEDGFVFMHKLRAEAERQKAIACADFTYAAVPIEEVPSVYSSGEMARLADSFEITEDDD